MSAVGAPTYDGSVLGVKIAVSLTVLAGFLAVGILGPVGLARLHDRVGGLFERVGRRLRRLRGEPPPVPTGRPIQLIAQDAHRLGHQFHCVPRGASFARFEARRQAYDLVLVEACAALEIDHLIGVLPAGPDLDEERLRVEGALGLAGLRLGDAA
jgi:hypothetical protein